MEAPKVESVVLEAHRLVHGDRQRAYSHPAIDYACTAALLNAMLGPHGRDVLKAPLQPEDAIMIMVQVKLSRESRQPKQDNRIDGPGYIECLEMVHQYRETHDFVSDFGGTWIPKQEG